MRTSSLLALVVSLAPVAASAQATTQVIATVTINATIGSPQTAQPTTAPTAAPTAPVLAAPLPVAPAPNTTPTYADTTGYVLPVQEMAATPAGTPVPTNDSTVVAPPPPPYGTMGQPMAVYLAPARRHATWYRGGPIPAGAVLEPRRRYGVISLGATAFVAAYGGAVMLGGICSGRCTGVDNFLYVPVVGPLLFAASIPNVDGTTLGIAVVDSLVQAVGVMAVVAGIARPRRVIVTNELARDDAPRRTAPTQWTVAPGAPGTSAGLTFAGTF